MSPARRDWPHDRVAHVQEDGTKRARRREARGVASNCGGGGGLLWGSTAAGRGASWAVARSSRPRSAPIRCGRMSVRYAIPEEWQLSRRRGWSDPGGRGHVGSSRRIGQSLTRVPAASERGGGVAEPASERVGPRVVGSEPKPCVVNFVPPAASRPR